MIKRPLRLLVFILLLHLANLNAQDSPFVRYPDINKDGSKIVFSFQGDLWTVSSSGGKAERLTIHEAYEGWPQWSPDDKSIAFSGNRYGNNDIFTIPADGGTPKRITFNSAEDVLNDFTDDNKLLFTTSRTFRHVEWDHEFGSVNADGGTPDLLIDAVGEMPTQSPDGKFIAFVKGWGRVSREAYRGSANNDIWIYNSGTNNYKKITDFDGHDNYPRWADSRTIYFISSRSGKYNIHKIKIDGDGNVLGDAIQITNYTDYGIRYFNVSGDGKFIVFERQTDIYVLNLEKGMAEKVDIQISSDYRFDPVVYKTFADKMTEFEVSPNGKYSAFVVRGEIFLSENDKDKSKTINLTNNPFRDQQISWLNDSTLIFISDREGQNDIYLIRSSDKKESNLFKSLKHETVRLTNTPEEESFPIISPDHQKISYQIGIGQLVVGDIDKNGKISKLVNLLDGWATPGNVSWSPDSKWLAYSLDDLNFNQEVFIHACDNHIAPLNVSMHPRIDGSPVWSKDGSKLAFTSNRSGNNILGVGNNDIWFVWLNNKDWEKTKDDWKELEKPVDEKKGKDSAAVKPVIIDVDNIYERLVQVTSIDGDEGNIQFSNDGETIYFTAKSLTKKNDDLFSIKWDGTEIKELTKEGQGLSNTRTDKDGKYLYFTSSGKLSRYDLKTNVSEPLPFEAKMIINYQVEKVQKFDEGWRTLRDGFYDPNFHGQNWEALKDKYKPWCLQTSTDQDFVDIYNLMLGELNASHMGMRGIPPREDLQKEITGLLGVSVKPEENGVRVLHVIENTPASKSQSKIEIGDLIKSVNGNVLNNKINYYSLLTNTAGEKVLLGIERQGKYIEVAIRPALSLETELYNEWVDTNRKLVDKYSNGKLGYLHIQAMGWGSFERFEREFTARAYGKDAIIIDVRFNGGGWTTDYLMTVLNYKQHAYTIPRGAAKNLLIEKEKFREYYPIGERLPYSAWTKPSIALCNQNSYSNAEIFSHAYKNLGIGKLVGVPTFGAVISTGARILIDGSYVRLPFRGWFVKADNTNMDFVPAIPDIIVENPANDKTDGNDLQLKRAVEELMKELK